MDFRYATEIVCIQGLPITSLDNYEKLVKTLTAVLNQFSKPTLSKNIFLPYDHKATGNIIGIALVKCAGPKPARKVVAGLDGWQIDGNHTTKACLLDSTCLEQFFGDQLLLVRGLPIESKQKISKLEALLVQRFSRLNPSTPMKNICLPRDPQTGKTFGFCFLHCNSAETALRVVKGNDNVELDCQHILRVLPLKSLFLDGSKNTGMGEHLIASVAGDISSATLTPGAVDLPKEALQAIVHLQAMRRRILAQRIYRLLLAHQETKKREEAAAVYIQWFFVRAHCRRQMEMKKGLHLQAVAATKLQAQFRGRIARKNYKTFVAKVVKVQALARGKITQQDSIPPSSPKRSFLDSILGLVRGILSFVGALVSRIQVTMAAGVFQNFQWVPCFKS